VKNPDVTHEIPLIQKRRRLYRKIVGGHAERAFNQQNRVAMLFLLFCFCQLVDLFECHVQPRNIVKDKIDESMHKTSKVEAN
jgi:hypothetical protein